MDNEISALLEWASSRGVILNGIAPRRLPGRGIGIIATRRLKANEDLLIVPTSALRSLDNTPRPIVENLKGARVHAILAASLILDHSPELPKWKAVLPTKAEIQKLMPFCWPSELQALLPPSAAAALAEQRAKFNEDWSLVSRVYGDDIPKDEFIYAWFLVNTRTFYHTSRKTQVLPKDDHMILQPVADLLNHSPHGCNVSYDENEFTVATVREHEPGEEIFISYGAHNNDFLLVEYGFVLPPTSNPWDEICLDTYLIPSLIAAKQKERLEGLGFWGNYLIDQETICYRTQIALRSLFLSPLQLQAVLDGERDENRDDAAARAELVKILRRTERDISQNIHDIENTTAGEMSMRAILRSRWMQMQSLVSTAIQRHEV